MPELPEVEITTRGVEPFMRGQTIASLIVRVPKLRWPIDKDLDQKLKGATIKSVERRAKYILINCTTSWLIVHLGMSGAYGLSGANHQNRRNTTISTCVSRMGQSSDTEIHVNLVQSFGRRAIRVNTHFCVDSGLNHLIQRLMETYSTERLGINTQP